MDGDGTLQVGQSRGVLLRTRCSSTEWKTTSNQLTTQCVQQDEEAL